MIHVHDLAVLPTFVSKFRCNIGHKEVIFKAGTFYIHNLTPAVVDLLLYLVTQARSQGESDWSDDPPPLKSGQVRFLWFTFLSVSEWFH